MNKYKGNLVAIEERVKFNNIRMLILAALLSIEQFIYGMIFSDPGTLERKTFFATAGVSMIYVLLLGLFCAHNKRYDKFNEKENKDKNGRFLAKSMIQYFYLAFLLFVAIYRAISVSTYNFTIPVIYIAVLYGISFLFYYPPTWTATMYVVTSAIFILLSRSENADFLYDNFMQDVIVNNILAWFGSVLSYRRFIKQVESIETIKLISEDKDELIHLRETIIEISGKVAVSDRSDALYQYILEKCLDLVPNAPFGSILMLKENGLLGIKAYVGFNEDEVELFKLPMEESFLYTVTKGKMDKTLIINRIRGVLIDENMVGVGENRFPVKAEIASPLIVDGEVLGIVCIDSDREDAFSEKDVYVIDYMTKQVAQVIRQQILYDKVLKLSQYDSLTGLYNRNTFDEIVEENLVDAKGKECVAYFLIADLDGLKSINDVYGHAIGDKMIQKFASVFSEFLGVIGSCARYGGDEFVFFTSSVMEEEIISNIKKIEEKLNKNPIVVDADMFNIGFSFGVCSSEEVGYAEELLYNQADKKMYKKKKRKKMK